MSIRVRACAFIVRDNKLLLAQHTKNNLNYWLLPGGGVEDNETLHEAVKRELLEETSLKINVGKMFFVCESISDKRHIVHVCFKATAPYGKLNVNPDERLSDAAFLSAEEIVNLDVRPNIKDFLINQLNNSKTDINDRYFGNLWI